MTRELIRRLILIGGIFQAIWLFLYIPAPVLDIRSVDFAKKYQETVRPRLAASPVDRARQSLLAEHAPQTLDEFIHKQTEDRLIDVTGPEWIAFFGQLPATNQSRYFRPGDKPLSQFQDRFSSHGLFRYLRLKDNAGDRYISVNSRPAGEAVSSGAPSRVAYPFRPWAWSFAVIGIAAYLAIPRLKRLPDAIMFGRASAIYVPDFLGVILTGMFFALPLLIAPDFSKVTTPEIFTESYGFLIFFWPFSIGCMYIFWYTARYASFQIVLTDQAIRWVTHGRDEAIHWDDIASVEPIEHRMPTWLRVLAILTIFVNVRAAIPANQINRYHRQGIIITRRDGWQLKLWRDMPGFERIAQSLDQAGHGLAAPAAL